MASDLGNPRINWVFTTNNYVETEIAALQERLTAHCKFACFEREIGEHGTPHLQGMICLKTKTRAHGVQILLGGHSWIAPMDGTVAQAQLYCSKDHRAMIEGAIYWEVGTLPVRGAHTMRETISLVDALEECTTLPQLMQDHPQLYCRFRPGLKDIYLARTIAVEKRIPRVLWFYGPTGTGKSREAFRIAQESGSWWKAPLSLDWFDGYDGQDVAIFEDFRKPTSGAKFRFESFLQLLDRYPVMVNIRAQAPVLWNPAIIIFTTPKSPRDTFAWKDMQGEKHDRDEEDLAQLERRITEIRHFTEPFVHQEEERPGEETEVDTSE